ncbi:MFS transporter [Bradyrhizobium guangdongense]
MQVVMRGMPSSRFAQRAAAEPSLAHLQATYATRSTSAAVALAIFVGCGARVIPALLAIPVQRDLNWPESYVAGPVALAVAVSALGSPLAAWGLLHVGARSLLFVSLLALSASLALSSFATSAWHLLLFWGIGVGLSGSLSAFVLAAMIGLRQHVRHCGTSFGLFTSIQCLGSAAGLLLASWATEVFGWHVVVNAGAAITLAAAFVVVLMIRPGRGRMWRESSTFDRPSYVGVTPRKGVIGRIAAIFFICGASTTGLIDSRLAMLCMGTGLN